MKKVCRVINALISILAILLCGYNVGNHFQNMTQICFGNWIFTLSICTWMVSISSSIVHFARKLAKRVNKNALGIVRGTLICADAFFVGYLLSFVKQILEPISNTQFLCILLLFFTTALIIGFSRRKKNVEVKEDDF